MGRGLQKTFPKEHIRMADNNMKRCSTSLIMWEMQIKTVTCHLIPIRMATIKKRQQKITRAGVRRWKNWNPCTLLLECKMVQLLQKTVWQILYSAKHLVWAQITFTIRITGVGTSLVVQRLRLHLPMQGVHAWSLVGELRYHMPLTKKFKRRKT